MRLVFLMYSIIHDSTLCLKIHLSLFTWDKLKQPYFHQCDSSLKWGEATRFFAHCSQSASAAVAKSGKTRKLRRLKRYQFAASVPTVQCAEVAKQYLSSRTVRKI